MANIILPPRWQARERDVTPEHIYWNRREFLRAMGFVGAAGLMASALPGCLQAEADNQSSSGAKALESPQPPLPGNVTRNSEFKVPERPTTPYDISTNYNNFYEFTTDKKRVKRLAQDFTTDPWSIEIKGLVKQPKKIGWEELVKKFPLEERLYRFRCVEAWAMTVPWVGFPLKKFIEWAEPTGEANYVRFQTVYRPEEMPGQKRQSWYSWPYYEGLTMEEAMNDLTLLAVGMYGKTLPNQNGAPVRVITPWKYGYKSIKSIVLMEFVKEQPATFWNDMQPDEYGFYSNVNPNKPHPRWSQAEERLIASGDTVDTKLYNGYGEWVGGLYADDQEYF